MFLNEGHQHLFVVKYSNSNQQHIFYVPPARKLVFSLQLTVAQCSILRYREMKCKNIT